MQARLVALLEWRKFVVLLERRRFEKRLGKQVSNIAWILRCNLQAQISSQLLKDSRLCRHLCIEPKLQ